MKPTEEKIHTDPSDLPIYLFKQGNNCEAYRYFGAHIETRAGESGVVFRVWAPHAAAISVVGEKCKIGRAVQQECRSALSQHGLMASSVQWRMYSNCSSSGSVTRKMNSE